MHIKVRICNYVIYIWPDEFNVITFFTEGRVIKNMVILCRFIGKMFIVGWVPTKVFITLGRERYRENNEEKE